jgi:hypothetical protein
MMPRRFQLALLLVPALAAMACDKKEAPPAPVDPHEHVEASPIGTAQTVLEKTFTLKKSAVFPFEIPAHAVRPHLHGIFESFVRGGTTATSEDSANIDFQILNEEQQSARLDNRPSEALFSVEGSHNQAVNFDLPASLSQPVKYYLVFESTDGGKTSKVVRASVRIDF